MKKRSTEHGDEGGLTDLFAQINGERAGHDPIASRLHFQFQGHKRGQNENESERGLHNSRCEKIAIAITRYPTM